MVVQESYTGTVSSGGTQKYARVIEGGKYQAEKARSIQQDSIERDKGDTPYQATQQIVGSPKQTK